MESGNRQFNVLFLCTGNSARSVMAECALNRLGAGRFRAFSAGSHPKGAIHPDTLAILAGLGYRIAGLRSKSWDEFAAPDSPPMDFIITVCDSAAGEVCPLWPGRPITAHWGLPDPAAFVGSAEDRRVAFARTCRALEHRVRRLITLPLATMDAQELRRQMDEIGKEPIG
ncbi:MAG TPA: arsenate reductase ArsC [Candidatus Binataceae bacterium]|nr:arsenate reductase ArsC [Candidatus Binataceae bacterium]